MRIAALALVALFAACSSKSAVDTKLEWKTDEAAAFAAAEEQKKGVLIDVTAEWCIPCKELGETMAEREVAAAINNRFVPLRFDVTEGTDADFAVQEKYRAQTVPAVIFVDASGSELGRVGRFADRAAFLAAMREAR